MAFWTLFWTALTIVAAWISLADIAGAVRHRYPPLAFRGATDLVICASFIVRAIGPSSVAADVISGVLFAVGTLLNVLIISRPDFQAAMSSRGITLRKLLMFRGR